MQRGARLLRIVTPKAEVETALLKATNDMFVTLTSEEDGCSCFSRFRLGVAIDTKSETERKSKLQ